MMREDLKTKCWEYIAVYQDDLYISSPTPDDIVNTLNERNPMRCYIWARISTH